MAMHTFGLTPGRLNKFKGEILAHAVPTEVLSKAGRQIMMPRHNSDTIVFRRWLPYGALATNSSTINQFFANGTGDRGNVITQAHQLQEGVTPPPDSIVPQDITAVVQQYGVLYGFSDKVYDLYEDDVPKAITEQIGERVTLVGELINWGVLRSCTNVYFGGAGTTIATVNGGLTLGMLRKIAKGLQANHGKPVNKQLSASGNFATEPVSIGYTVYCHTDMEPDIRDLPKFTPVEAYATGKPMGNEIGTCERFRFITSPDLPTIQDGGAAIASNGLYSTTGTSNDVYPLIVTAQDAWAQISVRGKDSLTPTFMSPNERSKSDPLGQRGYAGVQWWKTAVIENHGWMALAYVGSKVLT